MTLYCNCWAVDKLGLNENNINGLKIETERLGYKNTQLGQTNIHAKKKKKKIKKLFMQTHKIIIRLTNIFQIKIHKKNYSKEIYGL